MPQTPKGALRKHPFGSNLDLRQLTDLGLNNQL